MKKAITVILAGIVIIVCVILCVEFILKPRYVVDTTDVTSYVSNENAVYFSKLIKSSNAILTATVIQSATEDNVTVYTLQIGEMLKGKNTTGIGYLHIKNNVPLNLGEDYIIFSNNDKKYNYSEPFLDAPFVLELANDGKFKQINGIGKIIISDMENANIDYIRKNIIE